MTERGILFSAPMVRALLDGTKTQTRRALRVQPLDVLPMEGEKADREWVGLMEREPKPVGTIFRCKFGQPGDHLWVREAWAKTYVAQAGQEWIVYREGDNRTDYGGPWKPSIHMPRAASRILLEIVAVRIERLQDISEADAAAEGWSRRPEVSDDSHVHADAARDWYMDLWEQINGAGSWAANPWVWVVEFRRIDR